MHLHNFFVDYHNSLCEGEDDNTIDRIIFVDDMCDNGVFNISSTNIDLSMFLSASPSHNLLR